MKSSENPSKIFLPIYCHAIFLNIGHTHKIPHFYSITWENVKCLTFFPCSTCRQLLHHAGGGPPSHPERTGRCCDPPTHTNSPVIFSCPGALDGEFIMLAVLQIDALTAPRVKINEIKSQTWRHTNTHVLFWVNSQPWKIRVSERLATTLSTDMRLSSG